MEIRILSATDIRRALTARDAVDAMRIAFGELSAGTATVPVRSHLESARGLMLVMPAVLGNHGALGTKVVSVFPDNPSRGAPMVQGAVLLLDAETGRARALLDGASLTAVRTAAGSALATELLAPRDADTLAVFGAGPQGRSHVELLARTRRLREVRIVSRSETSAERLAARLSEVAETLTPELDPGPSPVVRVVRDSAEALDGARLVVTATSSSSPVFDARDLAPGAHVNAVGSYRPDMQEIDPDVLRRARVVVDQREAAWQEAGDLVIPLESGLIGSDAVDAELGEIVNGKAPPGPGDRDCTLFKSVGNAAQDIALAAAALAGAERADLGVVVPL
ncbi:MAG: ornithine cyclodeaminase [Acidobacteriota bacterium]|nr:ornithine cyclodeaminase [Acidobacteriota bacterium]